MSNAEYNRQYRRTLRKTVLDRYGGKCECCGVEDFEFLTLEHKNGDGAADKRRLMPNFKHGGTNGTALYKLYIELRDSSTLRDDIGVLCWNCNCSKHYSGQCPHKKLSK